MCSIRKIYDLQMNISVGGHGGRVHITEVVDDIKQVMLKDQLHCSPFAVTDSDFVADSIIEMGGMSDHDVWQID